MSEIKTLRSRTVYQNRWMRVREDEVRRADGSQGVYGVVERPDFAVIAALQDGELHLVQQYRYPVGARFWELPQGSWDEGSEVEPLQLAIAELREETGITAAHMRHLGHLYEAYGHATQAFDGYLATELSFGPQALEPEEQGLICKGFAVAEVMAMIERGEIRDAASVAVLGLLRIKGLL